MAGIVCVIMANVTNVITIIGIYLLPVTATRPFYKPIGIIFKPIKMKKKNACLFFFVSNMEKKGKPEKKESRGNLQNKTEKGAIVKNN
jgi:hypothetical protein